MPVACYFYITNSEEFMEFFNSLSPSMKKELVKRNKQEIDDPERKRGFRYSTKKETLQYICSSIDLYEGNITHKEISDIFHNIPLDNYKPIREL